MTDLPLGTLRYRHELSLVEKSVTLVVWVAAIAATVALGPQLCAIPDPQAPISFMSSTRPLMMLPALVIFGGLVAGLAALISGHLLPDVGLFTFALALGIYSTTGSTTAGLAPDLKSGILDRGTALLFVVEFLAWCGVLLAALLASSWVLIWTRNPGELKGDAGASVSANGGSEGKSRKEEASAGRISHPRVALADCAWTRQWWQQGSEGATPVAEGLAHLGAAAAISASVWLFLSLDSSHRMIHHGQACFLPAAAALLGAYLAFKWRPVRSSVWALGGTLAVALAGLLLSPFFAGASPNALPRVPIWPFLRPLPVQMAAWTIVGSLFGFWSAFKPFEAGGRSPSKPSAPMKAKTHRK